ncbi:exodeoxyribonuclease III [Actinotignum timonense]|uniref:exodeoxyribonuclease III n=1 Tax=Actinotignum TaxID=1653174 RepID=UPI00254A9E0B|nr:exodeoxyribonuclease III [Actinotignum timonense]MDK6906489.1 exodeoxyribonuclease III [Actinotignum timonense]MDK8782721.1 exodeoxyribonuclease III [Actinotignum timonense]MDY5139152.1 exodeoxyribonuclease III [Actinotignum timonense]
MRISTVNVNGIRAAARKGIAAWLEATAADIILLQEVRAPADITADIFAGTGYRIYTAVSDIKGRAGVAVAVREGIGVGEIRNHLGVGADGKPVSEEAPVDSGRWLEVELPDYQLRVVSAYLHSGVADNPEKMAAKYAHLERVSARLAQFDPAARTLVAGDFNIVHTEADIENWKSNHNRTSGVLDDEIAYLDRWFGGPWVDVQRALLEHNGHEGKGPYTWWSQRGKAFDNNVGWRIDYHMASPALATTAQSFTIGRAASYAERWSDHAPLTVDYQLEG